jgi:hypothetical protein
MWLTLFDNKRLLLAVWLVSTAAFAIAGASILNLSKFYHLTKRGVHDIGSVTALEPNNHNAVYYAYVVNRQGYSGVGTASSIDRKSETMTIGEAVPIMYDSADPESSCLGNADEQYRSLTRGVVFLASAPTLTLFVLYLKKGIHSPAAT